MVSWDVFTARMPWDWFKPQYALFFGQDEVSASDVKAFNRVKNILDTRYYEEVDFDKALQTSIKGLSAGLGDPYTMYYTPEEMKQFLENTSGNYVGIGVSVHMDENYLLTVADVYAGSPAKEAGILKNDKIVKVDNEDVTSIKDADLIVKKIKGTPGTKVKITVYRPDISDYKEFELERRQINISFISSELLPDKIGYIQIKQFDDDIAKDFEEHLNKLIGQGAKGLVIDLEIIRAATITRSYRLQTALFRKA
jgi:carboxyl-terminal processing protease